MTTVEEIERAIRALKPQEWEELRLWLDQYDVAQPIDARIQADLAVGRLDHLMQEALEDDSNGRVQPL